MPDVIPFPTVPRPTLRVVNAAGRPFHARLLMMGARYGLNDGLVVGREDRHATEAPMIEFWDATYEADPRFTPGLGQFTRGRYYVGTFLSRRMGQEAEQGLALDYGVPVWSLDADNVRQVTRWLVGDRDLGSHPDVGAIGDCARFGGHVEALPFPGHCVVCGQAIAERSAPALGGAPAGDAPALGGRGLRADLLVGITPMTCNDCSCRFTAWTDDASELFDLCRPCAAQYGPGR